MVGISASQDDRDLEVPMGLPLELRLPASDQDWQPVGSPGELELQSLERDDDGTTARLMAMGLGTTTLRFVTPSPMGGEEHFEVRVTVTPPLMNE